MEENEISLRPVEYVVSVVVPCYNEAGNIRVLYAALKKVFGPMRHELLFVDDGSQDDTLRLIKNLATEDPFVRYISFSRNFGHMNALKAGLDLAGGACVITMDADLQHPPELIPELLGKWEEGYEVVYTIRDDRRNIRWFNKVSSRIFYAILNFFSETKIEPGSADYRLLDRKVVEVLRKMSEKDLFLRGLVNWVGFKRMAIPFIPNKRDSGKTKYSLATKVRFAVMGITSFSTRPLKISVIIGFVIAFAAFVYGLFALYEALFTENTITGWTSLIVSVLFIGGLQLMMIGIVGEYLGKLYMEGKNRPTYIIRDSNIAHK